MSSEPGWPDLSATPAPYPRASRAPAPLAIQEGTNTGAARPLRRGTSETGAYLAEADSPQPPADPDMPVNSVARRRRPGRTRRGSFGPWASVRADQQRDPQIGDLQAASKEPL